ncbi:hypothetical protein CHS0354_009716 [Potamilus streckersoni]|uniref:Uncharacterized protein n=1 Tax=Potamilus streckersoni TaxID=2493646 RepID=A0AAE0S0A3_9BIVA|nr:hypothetical protein CHS0354_009716 [Potamilus streckersoni]
MSTKKFGSHTPVKLISTTEQIRRLETQLEISRQEKDNLLKEVIILRGFFDMAKIDKEMKKENPNIVDFDYTQLYMDALKSLVLERKNKELESRLPEIETNRNLYDKELKETEVLREKLAKAKRQLNEHRERLTLFEVKLPSIFGNSTRKREQSVNELEYKLNALQKELEKEKKYRFLYLSPESH